MTEADLTLEDRIFSASKVMVNILAESLMNEKVEGLSVPQYRILDMVYHGIDKPADVARMLDVTPPAITWILEKLEEKGFVARRHTAEDRRRVVLELTGKGEGVVSRVNARRRRQLNRVLGSMDAEAVSQLEGSLESFAMSYETLKDKEHGRGRV
jgi:DNA-binding MarR family transcriptional regulator